MEGHLLFNEAMKINEVAIIGGITKGNNDNCVYEDHLAFYLVKLFKYLIYGFNGNVCVYFIIFCFTLRHGLTQSIKCM